MIDIAWLIDDDISNDRSEFKNIHDGWCPQRLGWYTNAGFVKEVMLVGATVGQLAESLSSNLRGCGCKSHQ